MIKIVTIIGARPQIIKAAAISRKITESFRDSIREVIIHTGQHYDDNMSAVFIKELNIPAEDYNLHTGSGTHAKQTALMMEGIEKVLNEENPEGVIVYGDTNSTLAAGITAAKLYIPVFHVEAGLRSFNKRMPEEINRICCDHVSTLLFAPTTTAIINLKKEGFNADAKAPHSIDNPGVFLSGDVMFDNSIYFSKIAAERSNILSELKVEKDNFILATVHRENNTDDAENLSNIFTALLIVSEVSRKKVIIPIHPRTKKMMGQLLSDELKKQIINSSFLKLIEPASFLDMTLLESSCSMVITDSGGVQKEAYFFNKPCIILREETEWVELVNEGAAILTGTSVNRIEKAYSDLVHKKYVSGNIFGDGNASEKICVKILNHFGKNSK